MPRSGWLVTALIVAVALAGCTESPSVVEGLVAAVDPAAATLTLNVQDGEPLELSFADAEVGAPPELGDQVRVAYVEREGAQVALRVMNITRQAEQ